MATQKAIKEENIPPLLTNAEEEAIEWGVEEEILKETFKIILLNSGGLEESNTGYNQCTWEGSNELRSTGETQVTNREPPVNRNFQTVNWVQMEATGIWSSETSVPPVTVDSVLVEADPVHLSQDFKRKLADKDDQFEWVAKIIVVGPLHWATTKGVIHWHDLKFEARMLLDLVCARIIPSKNTTHIPIETAILVACIMD
ncbi:hypothetical protein HAX54_032674 [Datura stramonium]|uniref:Putative plant transposon protein domain-containing protein n=1 Tax=Datura stramonium TaxID=4076 RepID=A0ABS8VB54_DATST|nr:hypothetical protein [Datura stramonium]